MSPERYKPRKRMPDERQRRKVIRQNAVDRIDAPNFRNGLQDGTGYLCAARFWDVQQNETIVN